MRTRRAAVGDDVRAMRSDDEGREVVWDGGMGWRCVDGVDCWRTREQVSGCAVSDRESTHQPLGEAKASMWRETSRKWRDGDGGEAEDEEKEEEEDGNGRGWEERDV